MEDTRCSTHRAAWHGSPGVQAARDNHAKAGKTRLHLACDAPTKSLVFMSDTEDNCIQLQT